MKTVEPQFGAASFTCPHCGAIAQQVWFKLFRVSPDRGEKPVYYDYEEICRRVNLDRIKDKDTDQVAGLIERLRDHDVTWMGSSGSTGVEMANLNLSTCFSCKGSAVWVKDQLAYPETKSTIAATEDMPAPVRKDFEEAASIVDKSPRGAAALLRLCIQKLMPLLGEKGKKIDDDIASLVRKGLETDIQQALDVVRVIGNNAVHPGQIALEDDKATAVTLFELVNLIVERRIATPKRIAAMYGKLLPPTALEAIKKRDGQ